MKIKEASAAVERATDEAIQKALRHAPMTTGQLADLCDVAPSSIRAAIKRLQAQSFQIIQRADGYFDHAGQEAGGHAAIKFRDRGDGSMAFGVTTDNHLCNKHARLDVLNSLYDEFAREGVTTVFNCGNAIDGEMRFNKRELIVRPGMDAQCEYFAENMPQRKGMETLFITGDDHEGWYAQREGINIGERMEDIARKAGREDLKHLGYGEADIELKGKGGSSVIRLMHPGGGSAYAFSYTTQKIVEAFQGGEKPAIALGGHYHKFDYCYPRNVHFVQCGCTCDQTLFMRKKKIEAHVGGVVIKVRQDQSDGHIAAFDVRWIPFYDRGFYEQRFK